ncbi:MAG: hypothetical protein HQK49_08540 [Oligoflexia bacterium]|nr:hypothetical protein [Oligoflexia bacterium]
MKKVLALVIAVSVISMNVFALDINQNASKSKSVGQVADKCEKCEAIAQAKAEKEREEAAKASSSQKGGTR